MNFLKVSFQDSKRRITRVGNKTIATVRVYFKRSSLEAIFNEFGFGAIPTAIINIINKDGFKYDDKINGWAKNVSASIYLQEGDEDDPVKARNIAYSKVNLKAQAKSTVCIRHIYEALYDITNSFKMSYERMYNICDCESDGFINTLWTGYCDGKRHNL